MMLELLQEPSWFETACSGVQVALSVIIMGGLAALNLT